MLDDVRARARNHARALRDGTRPVSLDGRSVGDTVRARSGRSVLQAQVVDRFDAWALREHCRDLVAAALTRAGIDHAILPSPDDAPHRVVVASTDATRAGAALVTAGAGEALHTARVTGSGAGVARPLTADLPLRAGDVVRVFSARVSTAGRLLPTIGLGVDLEVWEETEGPLPSPDGPVLPAGTLLAPRTNPWARTLPRDGLAHWSAPEAPALEQVAFPVDIVYTWVDSDDPQWQQAYTAARREHDPAAANSTAWSASRFTDRDELRYSLRSVAAYASWVRTIHVVTNGQVPPWLDVDHPQIRIVRHDEIFPDAADLPTFNSHAIEANLHRIPGLAQHYLYLNDDVFLARPLRPEHFFTASGILRYFPSMVPVDDTPVGAHDLPVVAAFKNGRAVIEEHFGRRPTVRPRHTPHPQRRDVLEDIEAACPDLLRRTRSARFRSPTDVSVAAQLQAYWASATGRALASGTRYEFVDVGDPGSDRRIDRLLVRADLDCYCLNETDTDAPALAERRVRHVLTTLLPFASPYER